MTTDDGTVAGAADPRVVVAVDVGGTFVKVGTLGPSGLHRLARVPTGRQRGAAAVLAEVAATARDHVADARQRGLEVIAVGVVVPGVVDEQRGVAIEAAAFDWSALDVRDELVRTLGLPVSFGHDVRAGGRAEARYGRARDVDTALFVPVGTGIAAALVVDGVIRGGPTHQAGEIGQFLVTDPDGGDADGIALEDLASARAIEQRYRRLAAVPDDIVLDAAAVAQRIADDAIAAEVWSDAVEALGLVLAATIAAVDPEVVVIGGGLGAAGDVLLDPLRATLARQLRWRTVPTVVTSTFGPDAGFVGAALDAWDAAGADTADLADVLGGDSWVRTRAGLTDVAPAERR